MNNYIIATDSTCDFSPALLNELQVPILSLEFTVDGETYLDTVDEKQLSKPQFYKMLREGKQSVTGQVNEFRYIEEFEKHLKVGKDILYIAFASVLSGSYQTSLIARQELLEKYPERKIVIVDSCAASMGEGLLVYMACKEKEKGKSLEELAQWVEEKQKRICHWFTIDDLMFLKKGGRISSTTALAGTVLGIKPILHVNNEGRLLSIAKARGKDKALKVLAQKIEKAGSTDPNQTVFISHGDDLESAEKLRDMITEMYGITDIHISYVGPVIGTHAGPGVLALFFEGDKEILD